jgi:hypothetical protein
MIHRIMGLKISQRTGYKLEIVDNYNPFIWHIYFENMILSQTHMTIRISFVQYLDT